MDTAKCKTCGADVTLLVKFFSGAPIACDAATVRPGDTVYVRNLHREHVCAAPEKPKTQRSLFGDEE